MGVPGGSGPTCSTSTCRSRSAALSMPCARQACENAQVEQKVSWSPSLAEATRLAAGAAARLIGCRYYAAPAGRAIIRALRRAVSSVVEHLAFNQLVGG